jgi:hypothetical protein
MRITSWRRDILTETLCLGAQNGEKLDSVIIYDRDFDYDYFGFKVRPCSLHSADVPGRCSAARGLPEQRDVLSITPKQRVWCTSRHTAYQPS